MNSICARCHHSNPSESRYCNFCGNQMKTVEENVNGQPGIGTSLEHGEPFPAQFIQQLNQAALDLKLKMLEEFQEKATRWVKTQTIAATTALSIVVAFLAYAGFNAYSALKEYKEHIKSSEAAIQKNVLQVEDTRKNFLDLSKTALEDFKRKQEEIAESFTSTEKTIDEKMEDLSKFNTDKIRQYEKELKASLAVVGNLQKKTKDQLDQADRQAENIRRLENSRFRILVHYFRNTPRRLYQKNIDSLVNALFKKGFIVDENNISNVRSDRQEILYFSKSKNVAEKVKEIQQQLAEQFVKIPIQYESADSMDPLQVVIKLCPDLKMSGNDCIIESPENK